MIAASHRPVLADFDTVLNARRVTWPRTASWWLFLGVVTLAVVAVTTLMVGFFAAPRWFATTGMTIFSVASYTDLALVTFASVLTGVAAQRDRAAEDFVQQALVEDIQFEYGFTVPARRVPLEVGEVSQADVLIDGERRMVALVLPADDQPMVVIPVKSERPLLPLRAVVA